MITDALGELKDLLEEQADEPTLEFAKLDSAFHEKEDSLSATFDQLSQELGPCILRLTLPAIPRADRCGGSTISLA